MNCNFFAAHIVSAGILKIQMTGETLIYSGLVCDGASIVSNERGSTGICIEEEGPPGTIEINVTGAEAGKKPLTSEPAYCSLYDVPELSCEDEVVKSMLEISYGYYLRQMEIEGTNLAQGDQRMPEGSAEITGEAVVEDESAFDDPPNGKVPLPMDGHTLTKMFNQFKARTSKGNRKRENSKKEDVEGFAGTDNDKSCDKCRISENGLLIDFPKKNKFWSGFKLMLRHKSMIDQESVKKGNISPKDINETFAYNHKLLYENEMEQLRILSQLL